MLTTETKLGSSHKTRFCASYFRPIAVRSVTLLLIVGPLGCGSIKLPKALDGFSPVRTSNIEQTPSENEQPRGTYELLMKPRHGKGSKAIVPLHETTVLQDVIDASGAVKKYRAMEVTIYRPVNGSPVPLQMQCDYDSADDRVPPSENYEILPGDQVYLEEVSNSKIGRLLSDLGDFDN